MSEMHISEESMSRADRLPADFADFQMFERRLDCWPKKPNGSMAKFYHWNLPATSKFIHHPRGRQI